MQRVSQGCHRWTEQQIYTDLIKYCINYNSLLPCCDPPHLIKRVMTYLPMHESIIDHNSASVLYRNILNEAYVQAATGLTNSKIFKQEYIMQLNDVVAMTMLQTKFIVI